jgi:hypothetical protein
MVSALRKAFEKLEQILPESEQKALGDFHIGAAWCG